MTGGASCLQSRRARLRTTFSLLLVVALGATGCGGDDDEGAAPEETEEETEQGGETDQDAPGASGTADPSEIKTDFGADAETIRVGLLSDLSGAFSVLVKDTVVAQQAYWDKVNAEGGIGGRQIELVIADTKYDIPTHKQKFQAMKAQDGGGVLILAQSTGSPHSVAIKDELEAEHLIAIPVSFYSGWADPALGKNLFEAYSNYCFEAMNTIDWMHRNEGVKTLALATFPGEAGGDASKGVKLAAEALGIEIVYDGSGLIPPPTATTPNPDLSGVITSVADSKADLAFIGANPAALAQVMGGAVAKGFKGKWTGYSPSYTPTLLKSDVKGIIDSSYYWPAYTVALGTDVPGMDEMIDTIKAAKPDAIASDAYVYGWTEAQITDAILRAAAAAGDMTRAGVEKAAFDLDKVDFKGLAPPQSWKGSPDDYIVRETYMFKPRAALYKEAPLGEGSTGAELLEGPFASQVARDYDFATSGPCFKAAG